MAKVKNNLTFKRRTFLKEWRKFRKHTQESLAAEIGVTGGSISQLERAEIGYTQATLEALAVVLKCQPADIISRNPYADPPLPSSWDKLNPIQRKQAEKFMKSIMDDEEDQPSA